MLEISRHVCDFTPSNDRRPFPLIPFGQKIYRSMEVIEARIANSKLDFAKAIFARKIVCPQLQKKKMSTTVSDSETDRQILI